MDFGDLGIHAVIPDRFRDAASGLHLLSGHSYDEATARLQAEGFPPSGEYGSAAPGTWKRL
jgi:hypothetical protein